MLEARLRDVWTRVLRGVVHCAALSWQSAHPSRTCAPSAVLWDPACQLTAASPAPPVPDRSGARSSTQFASRRSFQSPQRRGARVSAVRAHCAATLDNFEPLTASSAESGNVLAGAGVSTDNQTDIDTNAEGDITAFTAPNIPVTIPFTVRSFPHPTDTEPHPKGSTRLAALLCSWWWKRYWQTASARLTRRRRPLSSCSAAWPLTPPSADPSAAGRKQGPRCGFHPPCHQRQHLRASHRKLRCGI